MSLFKVLTWLTWWLVAWLLFAKKSWVEFRRDLEWKTSKEKVWIFWKEILEIWKDVLEELKKLPDNEQVQELKALWQEKLEILIDEIKKNEKFWKSKLDELLPKLEKTINKIKENWWKIVDKKINIAKKEVKKIFKKEENLWVKMTKIFKK